LIFETAITEQSAAHLLSGKEEQRSGTEYVAECAFRFLKPNITENMRCLGTEFSAKSAFPFLKENF